LNPKLSCLSPTTGRTRFRFRVDDPHHGRYEGNQRLRTEVIPVTVSAGQR
jgi:hypothetical protein